MGRDKWHFSLLATLSAHQLSTVFANVSRELCVISSLFNK